MCKWSIKEGKKEDLLYALLLSLRNSACTTEKKQRLKLNSSCLRLPCRNIAISASLSSPLQGIKKELPVDEMVYHLTMEHFLPFSCVVHFTRAFDLADCITCNCADFSTPLPETSYSFGFVFSFNKRKFQSRISWHLRQKYLPRGMVLISSQRPIEKDSLFLKLSAA